MKKIATIILLILASVFLLFSACDIFHEEPPPPQSSKYIVEITEGKGVGVGVEQYYVADYEIEGLKIVLHDVYDWNSHSNSYDFVGSEIEAQQLA